MIIVVLFLLSLLVSAKKSERIFRELTKTMLVLSPAKIIEHKNVTVSFWKIKNGGFYYLTEKQEFHGKYKKYNFTSKNSEITILGLDKKKRKVEKELLRDVSIK